MKVIISDNLVSRNILQKVNSYLGDNEEIGAKQGVQKTYQVRRGAYNDFSKGFIPEKMIENI